MYHHPNTNRKQSIGDRVGQFYPYDLCCAISLPTLPASQVLSLVPTHRLRSFERNVLLTLSISRGAGTSTISKAEFLQI
jgi:hypothetical protein